MSFKGEEEADAESTVLHFITLNSYFTVIFFKNLRLF